MKIVFSTDQVYLHGGIEKVMAEKANYFADVLNYQVFILTTEQRGKAACYQLSSKIELVDIGVNYVREKSYFHPQNLARIPKHFRLWKAAVKKIKPDVIISCNYAFDFYWLPFSFKSAAKLKEYHSSRYFLEQSRKSVGFFGKLQFKLNDYIESKFDRLILLNPDEKPFYKSDNTEVIPNSIVVPGEVAPLVANRAIAAGRMAPVKGFDVMIAAWKQVVAACPDWELHLFGQGDQKYIDGLQRLIAQNDLTRHVFLRPATDALTTEMMHSSLYVMTSKTECYPMVLLEAISIGLPVVSFDCPTGPRHIVSDGDDGILIKNQDADALAKKIVFLIQNREKLHQLGHNAKNNARRFSNEVVMQQWVSLFNTLNE